MPTDAQLRMATVLGSPEKRKWAKEELEARESNRKYHLSMSQHSTRVI